MPGEHIQKEKEYGIKWRTIFKKELLTFADEVAKRLISEDGFDSNEDPFKMFHKIVKKDAIDAATFDAMTQADLLAMMQENLEILEKYLFQIRDMLKQPDESKFEKLKEETLKQVREH